MHISDVGKGTECVGSRSWSSGRLASDLREEADVARAGA